MKKHDVSGIRKLPWDALSCVAIGIALEVWVVVQHFLITHYVLNATLGLVATLILWYGVIRIMIYMHYGGKAIPWMVLAGVFYTLFRVHDMINTVNNHWLMNWAGSSFDLDELAKNILLVCSGMAVLIGGIRALYEAYHTQRQLMERNAALDREIAEHRASESRAQVSQEMLSVLVNAIPTSVFLVDLDGVIVVHNKFFSQFYNWTGADLRGRPLRDVMPAPLYEQGKAHAAQLVATGGQPQHFTSTFKGRTYDSKEYPVFDAQGAVAYIATFAQDITERLVEEESRILLETAVEHAAESIIITDTQGRIEYVNPAFEAMTGYCRDEIIGRTPALLRSGHPDAEFYRMLWQTIGAGQVWRGEFVNRRKDGELFREQATISPLTDARGAVTHYVAVKRDVTHERQLERQVQQAQKIEIIGTLAGGVAHDFNNVLAIILGHTELMLARLEAESPMRRNLEVIARTASRSSKLTRRLLAFSRQNAEEASPLDAATVVQEQINILRVYLPSNVVITEDLQQDAGYIYAELSEVQQVLVNLCTNASHAMQPAGGALHIALAPSELNQILSTTTGDLKPGDYIRLSVQDTGIGMDEETRLRIFEPFFTTKPPGIGTGLGLSMVHGSVTRFGGAIDVTSSPGRGTRFDVFWPAIEYVPIEEPRVDEKIYGEGRHVLVVDDMEDFNALTELNLVNYGFKVTAFSNPREALCFLTDNAVTVDVVITDYMMPEMNGADLARAMRAHAPELPIILLTGYASGITEENADKHGFNLVLRKPTSSDALARGLISVLPRSQAPDITKSPCTRDETR